MNKNIYIDIEETIKEEEKLLGAKKGSDHKMVQNPNGQFVDAHIDGNSLPRLSNIEIGRGQVETLLQLQTDSDTLRIIENVDSENEVLDRIKWGKKKKKEKSKRVIY
jgi:hypothetical protein